MKTQKFLPVLVAGLAFLLGGCGGGSGGGIGGTSVTSLGTVSGFGSVIVNGVEFETTTATTFSLDDSAGQESELRHGMVVKVEGQVSDDGRRGTATRVIFDSALEGPVTSIAEVAQGKVQVLEQTVLLDDLTVFDGTTAAALQVGNAVEVSGFPNAAGEVLARRVELKVSGTAVKVRGRIANLAGTTFAIGNLTVNAAGASLGALGTGDLVKVKGTLNGQGALVASSIERADRGIGAASVGARVELEGVVTSFTSGTTFAVDGQAVDASQATFVPAGAQGSLELNARVKVKGTMNDQGGIAAQQVILKAARNIKIEGKVTSVNASAGTVSVFAKSDGTGGIVVQADLSTQMRDNRGSGSQRNFGASSVAAGEEIRIRGSLQSGQVVASRLERRGDKTRVRLQGPASVDGTNLVILGVPVDTGSASTLRRMDDTTLGSAAAFLSDLGSLGANALVKVTGTFDSTTGIITADELELEAQHQFEHQTEIEKEFEFEHENEVELEFESENEQQSGTETRGRNRGTIDRLGSIFVNGQEISTVGATIRVDDNPGVESDLGAGMAVNVETRTDPVTGKVRATRIEAQSSLLGPVTAVPVVAAGGVVTGGTLMQGDLQVMGRRVRLDDMTVFANATPGQLAQGEIVEVHGQADATGVVHATRVERKAAGIGDSPEMEMKGTVEGMGASTFTMGGVKVDFAGATFDAVIGGGAGLENGMMVEVRSTQPPLLDGTIVAASIKAQNPELEHGAEVRVKGLVTAMTDSLHFDVDGQPVLAEPQDFFRGTQNDIGLDRQVEVEGTVNAQGVLEARQVKFELAKNVKIQAPLDGVNAAAGTVTALGVTVMVDEQTRMRDKGQGVTAFSLADVRGGEWVDIRAFADPVTGQLIAARLERETARSDGRVRLQGPLSTGSTQGSLNIQGAVVDTGTIARFDDELGNRFGANQAPDPAGFFTAASQSGKLVKVRGILSGSTVAWERAEIELAHQFDNQRKQGGELENEFVFEVENEFETSGSGGGQ